MTRLGALATCLATLMLAGAAAAPQIASAAARKNCGLISSQSWGGLWLTRNHVERVVLGARTTCRTAERIARAYNHNPTPEQPDGCVCFTSHRPQPYLFECGRGTGLAFHTIFMVYPTYRLWAAA
ncbi:MAG: hypothetical protein JO168_17305 [Solirubrobacterales bacterium]|nr:hypothetical protein [Solirubrobacterales bacterium]MBV9715050.1 hypothetical protein [Solirubrobacterales bacterium]